jgi:transposase InsO family protein
LGTRAPLAVPQWPNDRWSLDFVADQFIDGRRLRILVVVDDCTRECLALLADTRSPASGSLASSIGSSMSAASPRRS